MKKNASVVIEGEMLDILVGSTPLKGEKKDSVNTVRTPIVSQDITFKRNHLTTIEYLKILYLRLHCYLHIPGSTFLTLQA